MNDASPTLGFFASAAAFIAVVGYGIAQSMQVLQIVTYPLADILIYSFSLSISVPFLIAMLALHDTLAARQRLWTSGALLFGVMYVTYAVLMYTVQLNWARASLRTSSTAFLHLTRGATGSNAQSVRSPKD